MERREAEFNSLKEKFARRLIVNFLDIIIIRHFQKKTFSGYDATKFLNKKLKILLSPGTVYSTLYVMEREGLLESSNIDNKRIYKATGKGLQIDQLLLSSRQIEAFLDRISEQ